MIVHQVIREKKGLGLSANDLTFTKATSIIFLENYKNRQIMFTVATPPAMGSTSNLHKLIGHIKR